MSRILVIATVACCLTTPSRANGKLCSAQWDGVVVGISKQRNVVALYGQGYFDPEGGDTGSRIYTDSRRRISVEFVFGVDEIVDRITVWKGFHSPRSGSPSTARAMQTSELDAFRYMWGGVSIGSSKEDALRELGPPESEGNRWSYDVPCSACESAATVDLEFDRSGRIVRIEQYSNDE